MPETTVSAAGWGTIVALLIFIAASVWLGTMAQRVVEKGSFLKGYFLGNRGLGSWALALTATVQSGGTFMGFPSTVYSYGWVVALWIAGYMVVPITGFGVLGKRVSQLSRRAGAITVPDLFRARFDNHAAGLMASLLILFFMTFMMIAQFKAGALIMKVSLPGSKSLSMAEDVPSNESQPDAEKSGADASDASKSGGDTPTPKQEVDPYDNYYYFGLFVFALTVVGYTLIGGFLAAVWTDLFQSVMMFVGVMILLPLSLMAVGGLNAASRTLQYEVRMVNAPAADKVADRAAWDASLEACAPHETRLRELDAALRKFARSHAGHLPENLQQLLEDARPTPELKDLVQATTAKGWIYGGRDRSIDSKQSQRRSVLVLSPTDKDDFRSVLYSNGKIRSGKFSRPGELSSGPGPFDFQPLGVAISFFFVWVFAGLGSPAGMVRIMACKDTPTIRRSIFLLNSYNIFIYLPLILICICARTLIPDLDSKHSDEIIPRMTMLTTSGLPLGSFWAGLILAAPFGAVMATVSSYLVVIASGLVRDVYLRFINPHASERKIRWLSHFFMILVGAIAVAANIRPIDYLQRVVIFSGTCGAATFVVPALMAAYWRRASAAGAMAAMLTGVSGMLVSYTAGYLTKGEFGPYKLLGLDPLVWSLLASLAAGVLVSLATRPPSDELVSKLFDTLEESPGRAAASQA